MYLSSWGERAQARAHTFNEDNFILHHETIICFWLSIFCSNMNFLYDHILFFFYFLFIEIAVLEFTIFEFHSVSFYDSIVIEALVGRRECSIGTWHRKFPAIVINNNKIDHNGRTMYNGVVCITKIRDTFNVTEDVQWIPLNLRKFTQFLSLALAGTVHSIRSCSMGSGWLQLPMNVLVVGQWTPKMTKNRHRKFHFVITYTDVTF